MRASDPAGNPDPSPATRSFTVDTTGAPSADTDPPETTITKEPPNKTGKHKVTFKFTSSELGSTFECKVDKKPFKPFSSPKKVKVHDGKHKFQVRATDAAGNRAPIRTRSKASTPTRSSSRPP